jgi:hypothetical protein
MRPKNLAKIFRVKMLLFKSPLDTELLEENRSEMNKKLSLKNILPTRGKTVASRFFENL